MKKSCALAIVDDRSKPSSLAAEVFALERFAVLAIGKKRVYRRRRRNEAPPGIR